MDVGTSRSQPTKLSRPPAKPVLKWAGGKRQLLPELLAALPTTFRRYVEPMVGGGALFFTLAPQRALVADSNPELINLYRTIVSDLDGMIDLAAAWPLDEKTFYELRDLRFEDLDTTHAAARLLYLNRTCFNGLYRVNRQGQFNVPWGQYKQPKIIDRPVLEAARSSLRRAEILLGDYVQVLRSNAQAGDVVFLDPPYLPISEYSDFKRYTKEQFREDDHRRMRALVEELRERGCTTLITNSNHPLMHELYEGYSIRVVDTRRNINSRADRRTGQDIIISVPPRI